MGLQHLLEEKAGKSMCCWSLVPTWAMFTAQLVLEAPGTWETGNL